MAVVFVLGVQREVAGVYGEALVADEEGGADAELFCGELLRQALAVGGDGEYAALGVQLVDGEGGELACGGLCLGIYRAQREALVVEVEKLPGGVLGLHLEA